MPPGAVLKVLLSTLNAAQWKALTGSVGIGAANLTDRSQLDLFAALFPGDHLQAFRLSNVPRPDRIWRPIDISHDDLLRSRLRRAHTTSFVLPLPEGEGL